MAREKKTTEAFEVPSAAVPRLRGLFHSHISDCAFAEALIFWG